MKNFLLALFLIAIISATNSQIKRYAYAEEITLEPFGRLTSTNTSVFETCRPIFNNEKTLAKGIMAFGLNTDVLLDRTSQNEETQVEVNIFDGPISASTTPALVETCMTFLERHRFESISSASLICKTREFKKGYVVALCLKNQSTSWGNQLTKVRISGFEAKE